MKPAAVQRKKLRQVKNEIASVIAPNIRGQAQLDSILMRYPEKQRQLIFKTMRPFLKFDAVFPTVENTAEVTKESFSELKEKYGNSRV